VQRVGPTSPDSQDERGPIVLLVGSGNKICMSCGLDGSGGECAHCGNRSWYGPQSHEGQAFKHKKAKEAQESRGPQGETQFVSISEDLERLGGLRDSGDLSEQEFSVLKARLISGQGRPDPIEPPQEDPLIEPQELAQDAGPGDTESPAVASRQELQQQFANQLGSLLPKAGKKPDPDKSGNEGGATKKGSKLETAASTGCLVGCLVPVLIAVIVGVVALVGGSGDSGLDSELDRCVERMKGCDREIARQSCKLSLIEKYGD